MSAGDARPLSEHLFGQSIPESFVFSPDGRYLYGSSYYTGVSNIFRYEVAPGAVEAVSNAEAGFFRPVSLADGKLLLPTYTRPCCVPTIIHTPTPKGVSRGTLQSADLASTCPRTTAW